MRIEHLEVAAFGALHDFGSPDEAFGDFVVVLGSNEAGKSTLFEFICAMLYGMYPASAERHPYAPWGGDELLGSARIRLEGGVVEVTRKLRSSPSGTLLEGGAARPIRNEDLPFVSHVPSRVFRQVHALGLSELASFAEEGWEAVQDRVLGRLGANDLRPAREVMDELLDEARALWRPDRRGLPRSRKLDDAIREVAQRRPVVRAQETERRSAADRLAELRGVLRSAKAKRSADRETLERIRIYAPIRAELTRVAHLRQQAGDPSRLEGLTADPHAEWGRLDHAVRAAAAQVVQAEDERAATAREAEAIEAGDDALTAEEAAIEQLRASSAAAQARAGRLGAARQERRSLDRRLDDIVDRLPWVDEPRPDDLGRIRATRVAESYAAWLHHVGNPAEAPPTPPPASPLAAATGLIVIGGAMVGGAALGLLGVPPFSAIAPLVLALPGAAVTLLGWSIARSARRAAAEHRDRAEATRERSEAATAAREAARNAAADALAKIGLDAGDDPDPDLVDRLERARHLLRDREDREREVEALESESHALEREASRLREALGIGGVLDAAGTSVLLQDRLAAARERLSIARRAAARMPKLDAAVDAARAELARHRERRAAFLGRLESFASNDPRLALERVTACLEAHQEAERRTATLRDDHPDLDRLLADIRRAEDEGEPWLTQPDPIGALARDIEERSEEIEEWVALEKELEARARPGPDDETLDELEGELQRLRDERTSVRRGHDRLWILSQLVEAADREIRETHEPEILRRAGSFLSTLTSGRYDRLRIEPNESRALLVSGPAAADELEVGPPLSTGTQEQIFVALRLALVDQLDDGRVRLPLVLDEVFVNWDAGRRSRGLDLLREASQRRQIFLFTCHPHLADEAVGRGADLWKLPGPSVVRLERAAGDG